MIATVASPRLADGRSNSGASESDLTTILKSRESRELIIGLCGPLGCGIRSVFQSLRIELQEAGYEVIHLRISDLMQRLVRRNVATLGSLQAFLSSETDSELERISKLQDLGSRLREQSSTNIGAQLSMNEIAIWREQQPNNLAAEELASTKKTAFIIDQLKHPDEAELLRSVYRGVFYLIGVLSFESEKVNRLKDAKILREGAISLIEKDRRENAKSGQQLEKTLTYADYFIANNSKNLPTLQRNIRRFLQLAHGVNGITPTRDEIGMYAAYSASLQSACLSRQVGAAICDANGNILAVGKNDVPKHGGGLYSIEDGENDHRCINHGGKCYNTHNINKMKDDIRAIISKKQGVSADVVEEIIQEISENTRIGALIEYSRAIHAEMDAIIGLARNLHSSTLGATIYTTTFPCHNCARHIVAAGINHVIYIEPYEKSMAIDLHSDSICIEIASDNKVTVDQFEGVAPRRYQAFFIAKGRRKDSQGIAVNNTLSESSHIDPLLVSRYTETEQRITKHLNLKFDGSHLQEVNTDPGAA